MWEVWFVDGLFLGCDRNGKATATTKANTGILRCAQNDDFNTQNDDVTLEMTIKGTGDWG